ncbi:hypothetical protein [Microbacterium algeriense]|uniref:hypothetical protein n=1 Tax=Microbacterium algeriense TaxID=2615184 RepID=UPI0029B975BB|nr:hypothetical protein [Microbacterium algeriense]MDX2401415.1 hypothetical protein [Microbacterium algeriense]
MWGRKTKTTSVGFGDPNLGFVLILSGEGITSSRMGAAFEEPSALRLEDGSRGVQLGDGSPTGHHINMSLITQDTVVIMLGAERGELGGVILEHATPASPHWAQVVQVINEAGTPSVVGIPGIARSNPDGTVGIYVISGVGKETRGQARTMDLTRTTSTQIGAVLDRANIAWNYDEDGDIRVRFRSSQEPWTDLVFYEFDTSKADWSVRGSFLGAQRTPLGDGTERWDAPRDSLQPTALAQKVVDVYLIPKAEGVGIQIHAAVAPLRQPHPMHITVVPGDQKVSSIERSYPRYVGKHSEEGFWFSGGATGAGIAEENFIGMLREASAIGLEMFDHQFSGWFVSADI